MHCGARGRILNSVCPLCHAADAPKRMISHRIAAPIAAPPPFKIGVEDALSRETFHRRRGPSFRAQTLAEHEIERRHPERWRYLVLNRGRLYPGADDAKDLANEFPSLEPNTDRRVERQRAPARRLFCQIVIGSRGRAIAKQQYGPGAIHARRQPAQRLAEKSTLTCPARELASVSVCSGGSSAGTESTATMSNAVLRTRASTISRAMAPSSGWAMNSELRSIPILRAYSGSKPMSTSISAAIPPRRWAAATACKSTNSHLASFAETANRFARPNGRSGWSGRGVLGAHLCLPRCGSVRQRGVIPLLGDSVARFRLRGDRRRARRWLSSRV